MSGDAGDGDREALAVDLMSAVFGWQHLARYSGQTSEWLNLTLGAMARAALAAADRRATEGDLRARIEALADESPRCWMTKNDDLTCGEMVGGTFPNGVTFSIEACCLPCRLRAALAQPTTDGGGNDD